MQGKYKSKEKRKQRKGRCWLCFNKEIALMQNNKNPIAVTKNGKIHYTTLETWISTKTGPLKRNKTIETFIGLT